MFFELSRIATIGTKVVSGIEKDFFLDRLGLESLNLESSGNYLIENQ